MRPFLSVIVVLLLVGCTNATPHRQEQLGTDEVVTIPRMGNPPILDRQLSPGEWDGARLLTGTFTIDDGTLAAGDYPFRLWIGADERSLYVATVVMAGPNPWSRVIANGSTWEAGSVWYPDVLDLFFTNGEKGNLTVPSDWKGFPNSREQGSSTNDGYWSGQAWVLQAEGPGQGNFNDGRPDGGTWGRGGYAEDTLLWEAYIPRQPSSKGHDGLLVVAEEVFRAAVMFRRQGPLDENHQTGFDFPHDTHPGPGYTPEDYVHPEKWMKLRVDF